MADSNKKPCMRCKKVIGKTKCVQCQTCELWVHTECENIRPELFEILINPETYGGVCWNCDSCLSSTARLEKAIKIYEGRVREVEVRQERTDAEVEKLGRRMETSEQQSTQAEAKRQQEREEDRKDIYAEIRERESRKMNLVIHKVGELTRDGSTPEERRGWDLTTCDNLFKAMKINLRSEEAVQFCRRVGEVGDTPRPIIIGLWTQRDRHLILNRAPELRHTQYREVGIVPDLTNIQRKEEADLRAEAEDRNANLTQEDRSKNLCWLVVGRRGMRRLIKGKARDMEAGGVTATAAATQRTNLTTSLATRGGSGTPFARGGAPEPRTTLLDSRRRLEGGWLPAAQTESQQQLMRPRINSKRLRRDSATEMDQPPAATSQ